MEPDSIKEPIPTKIQEYLKSVTTDNLVADDVHALTNWIVTNYSQQDAWEDYWLERYWEELNDKDLGIVRKINLN